ncbi:MAG: serine/threonine-protein phosphatase [Firmicutes bacterium]|nr:serine/threonine-protein phosphatase [Bacillota bacterium]
MRVICAGKTTAGRIRTSNEDNLFLDGIWIEDGKQAGQRPAEGERLWHTYGVCDGMGGESYGEIASLLAVKTLADFDRPDLAQHFRDYIAQANRLICEETQRRLVNRMGAAVAVLSIAEDRAAICNLGDCRIYRFGSEGLRQLSRDHREQSPGLGKGTLTQHLGIPEDDFLLEPYILTDIPLEEETVFLLCSDGLTDMIPDGMLEALLREHGRETPASVAGRLLHAAAEQGGRDNITAMVVQITA